MNIVFHFPTPHDSCSSCPNRFQCMTMKIHKEYEWEHGQWKAHQMQEILPFRFGLACFSIIPYNRVTQMKLDLCSDKQSMVVEVNWA